ncbi:hypothetical protein EVAR_42787_1 [Eumeta japonica]|uniref:Uncharacterized protein n=1 Tax=Eumeta variegata TaxID=151549 RepID=A0A4C1WKQ5_EUMVA|nr:hypothetical protein EVAR_42787_1 [Eumeta japonica]
MRPAAKACIATRIGFNLIRIKSTGREPHAPPTKQPRAYNFPKRYRRSPRTARQRNTTLARCINESWTDIIRVQIINISGSKIMKVLSEYVSERKRSREYIVSAVFHVLRDAGDPDTRI